MAFTRKYQVSCRRSRAGQLLYLPAAGERYCMDHIQEQLLHCMVAYRLAQPQAALVSGMTDEEWHKLYDAAVQHKIEPIVYDTLWQNYAFCGKDAMLRQLWRQRAMIQASRQAARSVRIVTVAAALKREKIPYVLVKGLLCRQLYTKPDLRISGDEVLYISLTDREKCHRVLRESGLKPVADMQEGDVTHWGDPGTGLHIELHTSLFDSNGRREEMWMNKMFHAQLAHRVAVEVPGGSVDTFDPTIHFVFLVAHALKHFLTGGFGIRTLCDIVSFAQQYAGQIDVHQASRLLEQIHARVFVDQIFAVGQRWMGFDPAAAGWQYICTPDPEPLLLDSLDAGVYGQSSMSRKHSAGLVLQSVEKENAGVHLARVLFPDRESMQAKYPGLKEHPALLPVYWARRLGKYGTEVLRGRGKENSPLESIALSRKRTDMLVKYQIFPQPGGKKKSQNK